MVMLNIDSILKQLEVEKDEPIVVAVSGGPDSMALLKILQTYFKTIICAHVNHNTGRIGQNEDEQFVEEYCKSNNLIFENMKIDNYDGSNFHNQAHKKRYDFFEQMLKKYNSYYLFTAHHGDDLIETMLFRMMRGSTLKALSGIHEVSEQNGYYIVRPLLKYTKQQILSYNKQNNIVYRIDGSNEKEDYTRNRIRKHILPFLKSENENIHLKFLKLSEELSEVDNYIQKQVEIEVLNRFSHHILNTEDWYLLDEIMKKRILQTVLGIIYDKEQNKLEMKHIHQILKFIKSARSGAKMDLPGEYYVLKEYENLLFLKHSVKGGYEFVLEENLILPNGHSIEFLDEEQTNSNFVCRLSKDDIELPLMVRTRKEQDRMFVKGLQGSKKIKEIFINEKIPKHVRDNYPIVTDKNNNILWVPGLKKSQFDKTKEEKYDIILKYH